MILLGTIVNALAILIGTLLGRLLPNMKEATQKTVMQGLGLAVIVLGIQMTFAEKNLLIVILSVVIGAVLGEWVELDYKLNRLGLWIERKIEGKQQKKKETTLVPTPTVATAFVTATLVYCIGALAVIGAMDSGLRDDHTVLFTKSVLDGFSAIIFSSTLGYGVAFSAVAVFLYQGSIAVASTWIYELIGKGLMDLIISGMTATGGLLILAIGLNILEITKIRVANLLPSLLVVAGLIIGIEKYHVIWQMITK